MRDRNRREREERSTEPTSLGDIVSGLFLRRELARGVKVGRLARSWETVVGTRLASVSSPTRLENGTLVVAATSGPWGAQIGFLAEEIRARANRELGSETVLRVRVVVDPKEGG
jgi:hypothetical protein